MCTGSPTFRHMSNAGNDGSSIGLILDDVQVNMLKKSWRIENSRYLTSFRDEYRRSHSVPDKSL